MKQQLSINYQNIKLLNAIKSIGNWILKLKAECPKLKAINWLSHRKLPLQNCRSLQTATANYYCYLLQTATANCHLLPTATYCKLLFPFPFHKQYLIII